MGKQVNFFMALEDERVFCDFALSEKGVLMLPSRTNALPPPHLRAPLPTCQRTVDRELLLWHSGIFAEPEYVHHPAGFYSTAGSQKGGIEFTRSLTEAGTIRAGRLWTEHRGRTFYKIDGTLQDPAKKEAFDRWVSGLFGWIRKRYVKYADLFYIGPGAVQFQEMGGKLGPPDDPSTIERRLF